MPILLLAVWAAIFLALAAGARLLREAALAAFGVVAILTLLFTETLSLAGAVTPFWIALCWAGTLALALVFLGRRFPVGFGRVRAAWTPPDKWDVAVGAVLGCFALGTLIAAVAYPTTNYDSMTLHMTRTIFWAQNRSVAYYPTWDAAQLFSSALPDYLILNFRLLLGNDRISNLAQWFSYVFSVVAVSLAAFRLGAGRRGQQVAALAGASVPMAVLQASTTQDELTCALWGVAAAYCVLGFADDARTRCDSPVRQLWWVLAFAGSATLAVQSKATAYLVLPAFFAWLTWIALRQSGAKRAMTLVAIAAVCFIALNSAWYLRNARVLGFDVVGARAPTRGKHLTEATGPAQLATIALKNTSWLMATPSQAANGAMATAVSAVTLSFGGSTEDTMTKWPGSGPYAIPAGISLRDHDTAPAPLTVLLIALSAGVVLVSSTANTSQFRWYVTCGSIGFILVSSLVTPQIFNNRTLLGPVMLLIPVVGLAWSCLGLQSQRALRVVYATILVAVMCVGGTALLWNSHNPLLPIPKWTKLRSAPAYWSMPYDELRFAISPTYKSVTAAIAESASNNGIQRIGISVSGRSRFPIYPLLNSLSNHQLGYVDQTELPDLIKSPGFAPQAILRIAHIDEYPAVMNDGTRRGTMLVEPTRVLDWYVFFYRTP